MVCLNNCWIERLTYVGINHDHAHDTVMFIPPSPLSAVYIVEQLINSLTPFCTQSRIQPLFLCKLIIVHPNPSQTAKPQEQLAHETTILLHEEAVKFDM